VLVSAHKKEKRQNIARAVDMALFIGLDVGTQGAKAVVYDANRKSVVSRGTFPYSVLPTTVPGRAEQDPSLWIQVIPDLAAHTF
jgi:sugar (pentulose or hexulose) kinase